MKTLNLVQGSPEWHAHRDTHDNASEAPAMMNCSPHETRAELIKRLATGIKPEVSDAQQSRFNDGHRFEALCRPHAEEIIGQTLYPVTGSEDEGRLSASFDGLTMDESIGYEHKTLNNQLRQVMVEGATGADLPLMYRVQMEQQCMVSGAATILFMASKWQNETLVEKRHVWYETDPQLAEQIRAGWDQLEKDVAAYQPAPEDVKVTAEPIQALPALAIQIRGEVVSSNLPDFRAKADHYLTTIKYELATDDDFVNADAVARFCGDVEAKLEQAKDAMLAQTVSVSEAITLIDLYVGKFAKARIDLANKVKSEKQARKDNIILKARADFAAHVAGLNNELAPLRISPPQPDFDAAAKGLKTLTSIQAKVDAAMAAGKIFADGMAKDVRAKLAWQKEAAADHEFLFSDLQQLVAKPMEDFQLAVGTRVAQHKAAEAKRLEDERARIAEEERVKAQAAARQLQAQANEMAMQEIQGIGQQVFIAQAGRLGVRAGGTIECIRETLAETEAWTIDERFGALQAVAQSAKDRTVSEIRALLERAEEPAPAPAPEPTVATTQEPVPAPAVVRMPVRAAAPAAAPLFSPSLKLGDINARLHTCGISTTANGLRLLGFEPAAKDRSALLFHERDWPHILAAIVQRLEAITATAAA